MTDDRDRRTISFDSYTDEFDNVDPDIYINPDLASAPPVSGTSSPEISAEPDVTSAPEVNTSQGVGASKEVRAVPGSISAPQVNAVPETGVVKDLSPAKTPDPAPQYRPAQEYRSAQEYRPAQESAAASQFRSAQAAEERVFPEPLRVKPIDDHRYVTKGALVFCLVATMILSTILGALFGSMLSKKSDTSILPLPDTGSESTAPVTPSEPAGEDLTVSQIVDKNENAVVEILVSSTTTDYFGQMQIAEGAGSGVIFTQDGYIVTNFHVIQGANKVQVTLHNGETYPATIIGGDNANDIAVIKISATGLTVAEIGDSDTVDVGDTAVAIGNPLGQLGGTATSGIISALDRRLTIDGRTLNLMQTDAAINGGNSGGGLFNSKGQLIGIVDAKSSGVGIEGLAFAIPINSVIGTINDLIENTKVSSKPAVGITITEVSDENAQYYGLEGAGVYVAEVTGNNAKKAGFQKGDRIISINGKKIVSSQDFISRVRENKIGDTVTVVVSRNGQEIEIKTVLEELISTDN